MRKLEKICINRLRLIPLESHSTKDDDLDTYKKCRIIFLSELASLGFRVSNPDSFNVSALENYPQIISVLKKMRGGDVDYVPLFSGFPENIPEDEEYFIRRICGYLYPLLSTFDEGATLENGTFVPNFLFDLKDFGADPITQFQSLNLFNKGKKKQDNKKEDTNIEWITLKFIPVNLVEKSVKDFLKNTLYSKSSIKKAIRKDIDYLINKFGVGFVDPKNVSFKETRVSVMKFLWKNNETNTLRKYVSTPTDLLRMFAGLTGSDVSLSEKIIFPKLTRKQRRFVLSCLNSFSGGDLIENMLPYKGLWLSIGNVLHPGEYSKKYPKAFRAFDKLRNEKKFITFNSKMEKFLSPTISSDMENVFSLFRSRPGIFARRLHHLLRLYPEDRVIDEFKMISDQVEFKNLLVMKDHLSTISDLENRTIINKKGKVIVLKNRVKNTITNESIKKINDVIENSIIKKIKSNKFLENGKRIWVDENLKNYTVPLQQRKMSDGLLSVGRGTKIKFDSNKKVLRVFIYWKQHELRTDLDLSLMSFDENMNYVGHVSYTNLSSKGIVHSGDVQNAPYGASEFIDINLSKIKSEIRYIAPQIYIFYGEKFTDLDKSYSGWSFRGKSNSKYKTFDIKTVQNKINVIGIGRYAIPFLVDLKEKCLIYVDMFMKGHKNFNGVENSEQDVSMVSREIANMINTRPNMYDLVSYHVKASGSTFSPRKEAEVTFGIDENCDYNVRNIEETLSLML